MHDLVVNGFDYSVIDEDCRDDVRDTAVRIKVRMTRTAADIIDIGRDLSAVRTAVGHGHFLAWVDAEFAMKKSTAYNFINVAERFGDTFPTVGNLAEGVLYALAAPSTPDEIVAEVVERAVDGESFTAADIKAMKEEWSAEKRDLKAKASRADSIRSDFESQLADMRQKLAAARDDADTLRRENARQTPAAPAPLADDDAIERQLAALMNAWNRAGPEAREQFLAEIEMKEAA